MSDVGVLDKVMAILRSFTDDVVRLDPRTAAAELGMSPPTAYRLMKAMAGHGLLEQDGHGYRLGVALLHLGSRVADSLEVRHVARPHLEWLRDQTLENAELHLRHDTSRVPVEVMPSRLNLRPMGQVGVPFPLHNGASSKVLLAWLEADVSEALARASHAQHVGHGAGRDGFDAALLARELKTVREQGWASSDGEREAGLAAVAGPVRDRLGVVVAAVVLAAPSVRLQEQAKFDQAVDLTTEAASRISRGLGHAPDTTAGNATTGDAITREGATRGRDR